MHNVSTQQGDEDKGESCHRVGQEQNSNCQRFILLLLRIAVCSDPPSMCLAALVCSAWRFEASTAVFNSAASEFPPEGRFVMGYRPQSDMAVRNVHCAHRWHSSASRGLMASSQVREITAGPGGHITASLRYDDCRRVEPTVSHLSPAPVVMSSVQCTPQDL